MIKKSTILLVFILLLFTGCKKERISVVSNTRLLTRTDWIMGSFVDHSDNLSFRVSDSKYEFHEDGTYVVVPSDTLPIQYATWEFIDDEEYIRMGSNIFKIKIISRKLFGVQYGTIDIFYEPYGD